MSRLAAVLLGVLLPALVGAAEPKDAIKGHKYEIQPTPYRDEGRGDPFAPMVPLRAVRQRDDWKVRVVSLTLSSVIMGKRQVAIFNEVHGPRYSYILTNGVLIGPDHRPIPGVAGTIEPVGLRGGYRVVLKQGAERIEYAMTNWDPAGLSSARSGRKSQTSGSSGTSNQRRNTSGGGL
jgi:hypothetical protein